MIDYKIPEFLKDHPELTCDGIDWRQRGSDYNNNRIMYIDVNAVDTVDFNAAMSNVNDLVDQGFPSKYSGGYLAQESSDPWFLRNSDFTNEGGWTLDPNETRPANTAVQYYVKAKVVF